MKNLKINKFDIALFLIVIVTNIFMAITQGVNCLGMASAVIGVTYAILIVKGRREALPLAMLNNLIYGYMSFKSGLYGEMALNILYYLPMGAFAFAYWKKNLEKGESIHTKSLGVNGWQNTTIGTIALTLIIYFVLRYTGDKLPHLDSIATSTAIVSQILQLGKYKESWIGWLIVNIITIVTWIGTVVVDSTMLPVAIPLIIMFSAYTLNAMRGIKIWNKLSK